VVEGELTIRDFFEVEIKAIQSILIGATSQPDVQIWRGTVKGEFLVS
jgi:hypothetical protein